ncbi:MAG TPA: hypothetical protein GX513_11590 [Firmicutes bacterium]|nr:hypothetical protein [Bacillota bacterium]
MPQCTVVAVKLEARSTFAPKVQEILTKHGSVIKTRLGLHELSREEEGLILLVVCGNREQAAALLADLKPVPTIKVFSMEV